MTRYPMFGSSQPSSSNDNAPGSPIPPKVGSSGNSSHAQRALEPHDLEAALQLLVARAQYITGATGAALALAQGEEMVCRASAGPCAPPVGARLQVRSGLTGESVSRKQLLRCDNAENDPRVNLETCRELGIASIVVLPLLSAGGEVRGLFELFSDHPYAFEERDLIALERMAELTRTALDLAEKTAIVIPSRPKTDPSSVEPQAVLDSSQSVAAAAESKSSALVQESEPRPAPPEIAPKDTEDTLAETQFAASPSAFVALQPAQVPESMQPVETQLAASLPAPAGAQALAFPESMRRIQKCSSCGFPVSEGRTLCVDCEQKRDREPGSEETMPAEFVPSFGLSASAEPVEESWLANHVNLLAILVLILSIVVAVVVFR